MIVTPAIGGGMHRVLLGACFLARKSREPGVGADALLISMFDSVAELRAVLDFPTSGPSARRATRSRATMAPAGTTDIELEAAGAMREAHWRVCGVGKPAPQWEQEAYEAVLRALNSAAAARLPWAGNNHLLEALLADPHGRVREFLGYRQLNLDMLDEAARRLWPVTDREPRRRQLVKFLQDKGVLVDPDSPAPAKPKQPWMSRFITGKARVGPTLVALEEQAMINTVRLGHPRVTPAHLILALLSFEDQMLATGLRPRAELRAANGPLFVDFGILLAAAVPRVAGMESSDATAAPDKRSAWRTKLGNPAWTVAAARIADRARSLLPEPGGVHLLQACLDDEDETGRQLLRRLGADLDLVSTEIRRRLQA